MPGADLSRTVGWFTAAYPVRLDLAGIDVEAVERGGTAAGTAIKTVKEHLRAVPDHGIGYGMLRYLDDEAAPRSKPCRHPGSPSTSTAGARCRTPSRTSNSAVASIPLSRYRR